MSSNKHTTYTNLRLQGSEGKQQAKNQSGKNNMVLILIQAVEQNKFVWLAADIIFLHWLTLVVAASHDMKFITTHTYLQDSSNSVSSLRETIVLYQQGWFRVLTLMMDWEFHKIKPHLPEVSVNTTSAGRLMGNVDCHIHTIKEWTQDIIYTLPYKFSQPDLGCNQSWSNWEPTRDIQVLLSDYWRCNQKKAVPKNANANVSYPKDAGVAT